MVRTLGACSVTDDVEQVTTCLWDCSKAASWSYLRTVSAVAEQRRLEYISYYMVNRSQIQRVKRFADFVSVTP